MIRIAVVDDEKEQIEKIKQIVSAFFCEKRISISIDSFTNGEDLLNTATIYDLIFLDIQMPGIDGIETGQRLRVNNKNAVMFYITSYKDYIQQSMTIHPFAFIVKPFTDDDIQKNLDDYLKYHYNAKKKQNEPFIIDTIDDRHLNVNMNEILYFSYKGERITAVFMKNSSFEIKNSLMAIYEQLNHDYFVIPHRSFIVNLQHIKEIDGKSKNIVMKNGDLIFISRRKYNGQHRTTHQVRNEQKKNDPQNSRSHRNTLYFESQGALNQTDRENLSARYRFANVNMIFSLAVCFFKPR